MKRFVALLVVVLALLMALTSTVHAQAERENQEPPSVPEEALTQDELETLIAGNPGFYIDPDYEGLMPTRSEAQEILSLLRKLTVTVKPSSTQPPTTASGYSAGTIRKSCETHFWVGITWEGVKFRPVHVGWATHSALMETANEEFISVVDPPHSISFHFPYTIRLSHFELYGFRGWADNPYNESVSTTTWRLGADITVRAYIAGIGINLVNGRDMSCKIRL